MWSENSVCFFKYAAEKTWVEVVVLKKSAPAQVMNEKDLIFCLWVLYNFILQRGKMTREEKEYCIIYLVGLFQSSR